MARIRSTPPSHKPTPSDSTRATKIRYILQGQLRALSVPSHEFADASPAVTGAGRANGRLGDYLLNYGLLSEGDLIATLAEQHRRTVQNQPIALGDLLVERGLLTVHELVTVLMLQQLDREQGPVHGTPLRLGELLVQAGLITADQLATALTLQSEARQRGESPRLGQILITEGVLTRRDLANTLADQRRARRS